MRTLLFLFRVRQQAEFFLDLQLAPFQGTPDDIGRQLRRIEGDQQEGRLEGICRLGLAQESMKTFRPASVME